MAVKIVSGPAKGRDDPVRTAFIRLALDKDK